MIRFTAALGAVCLLAAAPGARAQQAPTQQPLGPRLGQCMVLKSTGADRLVVARWLLAVLASAPQAADVTTLKPGKKDVSDRDMATVFTRLIARDCAAEAKALFASGAGSGAGFTVAGEALGRVAMEELLTNPGAKQAFEGYTRFLKPEDFRGLAPASK